MKKKKWKWKQTGKKIENVKLKNKEITREKGEKLLIMKKEKFEN